MLEIQFVVGLIIGVIIFLGGIHFYGKYATMTKSSACPNILMKVDSKYFLYNSKLDRVPGANPIQFDTLEDCLKYVNYETTVGDNTETTSQSLMYTAYVIARIKDDFRK